MPLSLSRHSSINSIPEEIYQSDDNQEVNNIVTQDIPIQCSDMENFEKSFTKNHNLGKILLSLAATNLELCKKNNISPDIDLKSICTDFTKGLRLERSKLSSKINETSDSIEKQILRKDLSYHTINQSVSPPSYFSPVDVLTDSKSLSDALKILPIKGNDKFSGNNSTTIFEFLNHMNRAQELLNLSKKEFLKYFLQCCTNRPYDLVANYISFGFSIADIYYSLITLYDSRLSPENARVKLSSFVASKHMNFAKCQAHIMNLSSRISDSLPNGPSRTSLYNLEANNALCRALPTTSSQLVSNQLNSLACRLQKAPSFVELCQSLTKYENSINSDILQNGLSNNRINTNNFLPLKRNNYKTNFIGIKNKNDYSNQHKKFPNQKQNVSKNNYRQFSNYTPAKRQPYHLNQISKFNNTNSNNYKNDYNSKNSFKSKKKCTLCGDIGHSAKDTCFKMRNSNNRIISVIPSYRACSYCKQHLNKELFHPESLCFNKKKSASTD